MLTENFSLISSHYLKLGTQNRTYKAAIDKASKVDRKDALKHVEKVKSDTINSLTHESIPNPSYLILKY